MAKKKNNRLFISLFLILSFFTVIILRLGYIQLYKHDKYVKQARQQRNRDIGLLAKRGNIYDRDGQKLAISIEKETVFATPYLIKNHVKVSVSLASILKMSKNEILTKLSQPKGFVFIKRKISKNEADRIRKLDVEGLGLYKEHKRYYPSGRTASQILGFVGLDNNGLSGLELKFDKSLRGQPGRLKDETDAFGNAIPGTKGLFRKPKDGKNVVLTINRDIQYKAQLELKNAVKEWDAISGSVIVMDPQNGEILAMASEPGFDSNNFSKASKESLKNTNLTNLYEPGSTFKILPAAASVEEGLYQSNSMFYLPPTINIAGKNIKEAHERPAVNWSLAKIIAESSNVGMSKIGLSLGKKRLYSYLQKFGVLNKTGIDFPGEVSGYVPKPKYWYGQTIETVSFGQGVAVTPLQLARVYSVIANGGKLYKPYIVKKILSDSNKTIFETKPKMVRRVINQKSAFEANLMLQEVVKNGTGAAAAIKGYTVSGKTGTAQKPNVGSKGYSKKYISSFIGFAPSENAKVLVLVVVDSPTKAIYGSQVAAPAFKNIMEFSLQKLNIAPE